LIIFGKYFVRASCYFGFVFIPNGLAILTAALQEQFRIVRSSACTRRRVRPDGQVWSARTAPKGEHRYFVSERGFLGLKIL
jgi:hypothetical protein